MLRIGSYFEFLSSFGPQISSTHHSGNFILPYRPSSFLQLTSHPYAPITLLTLFKYLHDLYQKLLIQFPTVGGTLFEPAIITAFGHLKHFTHHLNGKSGSVITYELVDLPSLLEKMLTAFFKMSLSILASRSSFCNRAFSFSKSVILGFPFPGKLLSWYFSCSLLHRYNNSG